MRDVPSPIDFSQPEAARAWANAANAKRPWRIDFCKHIVSELRSLPTPATRILELGSGPGFLAEVVLRKLPTISYTLLDSSPAMHNLARDRLGEASNVRFVEADFKRQGWWSNLRAYDAVVTMQAVHELRHKRHAVGLHRSVRRLLIPGGLYLVCDHVAGPGGQPDTELYMTVGEQAEALAAAGFEHVQIVFEKGGLVLHRGRTARYPAGSYRRNSPSEPR